MRPVSTLVLCAPDRPALDELQVGNDWVRLHCFAKTLAGAMPR